MIKKPQLNKVISILIIAILSFSIISSLNVSSYSESQDDGVWFDDFNDITGIDDTKSYNYENYNGYIKLPTSSATSRDYDFSDEDEDNQDVHEASKGYKYLIKSKLTDIDDSILIGKTKNFADDSSLGYSIDKISGLNDGKSFETTGTCYSKDDSRFVLTDLTSCAFNHYTFNLDVKKSEINSVSFNWYGEYQDDANVKDIVIYVWNYPVQSITEAIGTWDKKGQVSYDSTNIGNINGDIKFIIPDNSYVSEGKQVDVLVMAIPDEHGTPIKFRTDYVKLTIETDQGYSIDEAKIVSKNIDANNLKQWESIICQGSRTSGNLILRIQILDGNNNLISDNYLKGNKNGFSTSDFPLDISDIPVSTDIIKLSATLKTKTVKLTPRLYKWGVSWRTHEKSYHDSFKSDIRLDKIEGATVDKSNGKIVLSDYYGEWPILNLDSSNTRSYGGYGPKNDDMYYYSARNLVGGGFRSPIIIDDKLYVASQNSNQIIAFDATVSYNDVGKEVKPVDQSQEKYILNSGIASNDEVIIVPNSEINSENKIYALDKDNLEQELWNYSFTDGGLLGNTICYSSAPNIANDKVFLTSWSGIFDTKVLQSILNLFQDLSSIALGNNKLIVLDVSSGNKIWIKSLPGGSFSTPAVKDGLVVAGCNYALGDNLVAYDEDSGEELWSKKIGIFGKSSPVIYDEFVYAVVKEQSLSSVFGDLKLFCLDKSTGDIIWNKTVSENIGVVDGFYDSSNKQTYLYYPLSTSTPAIVDNKIFVTTPDGKIKSYDCVSGEELWSDDLPEKPKVTMNCVSPVVTGNKLYVVTPRNSKSLFAENYGSVSAYKLEYSSDDIEPLWTYKCNLNSLVENAIDIVMASPIVSNGVLYLSLTNSIEDLDGRLLAIGNYTENDYSRIVTKPIILPNGQWWSVFNADYSENEFNTITFNILDENHNELMADINGTNQALSDINKGVIRLEAIFEITDDTKDKPVLNSWNVNWTTDNNLPVFDEDTFKPDPTGFINTNIPKCTIIVRDDEPGLDKESARYKIKYTTINDDDEKIEVTSSWINADTIGNNDRELTMACDVSKTEFSDEIEEILSITLSISDKLGFEATKTIDFTMDNEKPQSHITNKDDINNKNLNQEFNISATASDSDGSGIKNVNLRYRYRKTEGESWGLWENYSEPLDPGVFSWWFGMIDNDLLESGFYQVVTTAEDKAGNKEDIDDKDSSDIVGFFFDMIKPEYENLGEDEYKTREPFEIEFSFEDDYELKKAEYQIIGIHGLNEWVLIKNNIGEKTLTEIINVSDYWDEMQNQESYYLYIRVTDINDNVYKTSETDAIEITKDISAGKSQVDISDLKETSFDNKHEIEVNVEDPEEIEKVTLYYRYSEDNETWGEWQVYDVPDTEAPFKWDFETEKDGYYQFKTIVEDSYGVVQESDIESAHLSLFPIMPVIILIIVAIVIIIIVIALLYRRKQINEF